MRRWAVVVAAISVAGCQPGGPSDIVTEVRPTQVLKDFAMQDIREGVTAMVLEASEGRVFDPQNLAELDKPYVTFFKKGVVASHMQAPAGRVFTQSHVVEAWGGVTVVTTDSATLTTERLQYDPEARLIFTKEAVRLVKPDSVTEGVGLEADPGLERVKITRQTVHLKSAKKKGSKP